MGDNIEKVLNGILENYKAVALEAVKDAAHKGQEDIMKEAKKYLQEYYANYPNPKMYKRKYALKRAILPYWSDKTGSKGISISIGVQYNAGALKGAYKSGSKYHQSGSTWKPVPWEVRHDSDMFSSDFGVPDPNWILDNYLQGVHPWAQTDSQGTEEKMDKFFDEELPERLSEYVQTAMFNAIDSKL